MSTPAHKWRLATVFLFNFWTLVPFVGSHAWATTSASSELTLLACEYAKAAKTIYPNSSSWENRQQGIRVNLDAYAIQFSKHDWSSQGNKIFVLAQALYHKIVGYDGFYAYQAMVPDSKIDYSSLLAQISQFRFFGYSQIGNRIKSAGIDGEDLKTAVTAISSEYKNKGYVFDLSFLKGNPLEPTLVGLGPSADELAVWLLAQPDSSVSYTALFQKSLGLTKADPLAAIGLIAGLSAADATGRGNLGTIFTDKIIIPESMAKFRDRAGVNYHFWSYMALAMIKSPASLRILSFGYENILQGDSQEGSADQTAISTANLAQWIHVQRILPKECR